MALDNGRISHAYLFSGPRGCGKTSTARILARSLNCEHGPTSTPCGECASCRALAPGGQGNLDVTELDAASHGNVDDMRELRETAYYAPSDSRYRIIIIDEAHMITQAGSNALLKVVEEPPEHLIFIFATTEPEKVIPTIRSRVQHYPFRLLTPPTMKELLHDIAADEHIAVEDSVYPLVIRAGGGSPRDSLSILDQLFSGVPEGEELTYDLAAPLLGVTDSSLIDAAVRAIATHDRAAAFGLVGKVIDAGIDPKRFTTDLLDRLRDLMVLQTVPEALTSGLVDAPAAAHDTFAEEVAAFGGQDLPRVAAVAAEGLDSMRGTLAPRIMLEVLMAKLLTVGTQQTMASQPATAAAPGTGAPEPSANAAKYMRPSQRAAMEAQQSPAAPQQPPAEQEPEPQEVQQAPVAHEPEPQEVQQPEPQQQKQEQPFTVVQLPAEAEVPEPAPEPAPAATPAPTAPAVTVDTITAVWRDVLEVLSEQRNNRTARILLTSAKVVAVRDNTVFISLLTGALAQRLNGDPHHADVSAALSQVLGTPVTAQAVTGSQLPKGEPGAGEPPAPPAQVAQPQQPAQPGQQRSFSGSVDAETSTESGADDSAFSEPPMPQDWEAVMPEESRELEESEGLEAPAPYEVPPQTVAPVEPVAPLDPEPPTQHEEPSTPVLTPEEERAQEEEEMVRAAQEDAANFDHRTPMQVAIEMVESELGGTVYER